MCYDLITNDNRNYIIPRITRWAQKKIRLQNNRGDPSGKFATSAATVSRMFHAPDAASNPSRRSRRTRHQTRGSRRKQAERPKDGTRRFGQECRATDRDSTGSSPGSAWNGGRRRNGRTRSQAVVVGLGQWKIEYYYQFIQIILCVHRWHFRTLPISKFLFYANSFLSVILIDSIGTNGGSK